MRDFYGYSPFHAGILVGRQVQGMRRALIQDALKKIKEIGITSLFMRQGSESSDLNILIGVFQRNQVFYQWFSKELKDTVSMRSH